jgi:hypothetical protein
MCWGIGSFLAAGILRGTLSLPGDTAWKVPYALQWVWPVPLFIIAWMAPESEHHLFHRYSTNTDLQVLSTWYERIESPKPVKSSASSPDPDTELSE